MHEIVLERFIDHHDPHDEGRVVHETQLLLLEALELQLLEGQEARQLVLLALRGRTLEEGPGVQSARPALEGKIVEDPRSSVEGGRGFSQQRMLLRV